MFDPDDKPDDDSELPEHEDELPADDLRPGRRDAPAIAAVPYR
jgi:hypothetical protein